MPNPQLTGRSSSFVISDKIYLVNEKFKVRLMDNCVKVIPPSGCVMNTP